MIKDLEAYARLCDREQWDALRAMTIDESIAVMEALLTRSSWTSPSSPTTIP